MYDGGGDGHSIFTRGLLDALREGGEIIDGYQLYTQIRRSVILGAEQTPQYSDIRFAGDEGGDFLFVPTRAVVAVEEPAGQPAVADRTTELAYWDSVKDSDNPAERRSYLSAYPEGAFADLARLRVEKLEGASQQHDRERAAQREREFWETVRNSSDPAALRAYIERYPAGAFADLARFRLDEIETKQAARRQQEEARAREREHWLSVMDSREPEMLRTYLDAYPGGAYADLAHLRLVGLENEPAAATREREAAEPEIAALSEPAAPSTSVLRTDPQYDGVWKGAWLPSGDCWLVKLELRVTGTSVKGSLRSTGGDYDHEFLGALDPDGSFLFKHKGRTLKGQLNAATGTATGRSTGATCRGDFKLSRE